jgi:hypothetical protein
MRHWGKPMHRPARDVDHTAAPAVGFGGAGVRNDPPSSARSNVAAPADEDAGFDEELTFPADDDTFPGWGAARLGIP